MQKSTTICGIKRIFKLHKKAKLSLHLFDSEGKKLDPIFEYKDFEFGKHIKKIDI